MLGLVEGAHGRSLQEGLRGELGFQVVSIKIEVLLANLLVSVRG